VPKHLPALITPPLDHGEVRFVDGLAALKEDLGQWLPAPGIEGRGFWHRLLPSDAVSYLICA
jgi:hypothetical protein